MGKSVLQQLKENEREMRRKLIIDAAKSLFKKIPFHKIGMRTIANEAGISVASLYQYFPSQDDLFAEILKNDLNMVKNMLWNEKTTIESISIDIVDFFLENEDIFHLASHFMVRGEKNITTMKKFNSSKEIFFKLINSTLIKAYPESELINYSKAFFSALFGNIIAFRNSINPEDSKGKESLYEIVKITANAFQISIDSELKVKNSA